MNIPGIDGRNKRDIIDNIAKLARSYTPEWRFSTGDPDVGSVLALIFADMFEGTVRRYNNVLYKHHIAFLNNLDIRIKPSVPARGIVCFGQAAEFLSGIFVPAGTKLVATSEETGSNMIFETERGVFVTPAQISALLYYSPGNDRIALLYDGSDNLADLDAGLFDTGEGKNLQRHFLALCHNAVLGAKGNVCLRISFKDGKGAGHLADPALVRWLYLQDGEWKPFDRYKLEEGYLVLEADNAEIRAEEFEGINNCWIGCEIPDMRGRSSFSIGNLRLTTAKQDISPDVIYVDDAEQQKDKFHPFGEELSLYRECYVACSEAFAKKNARVSVTFDLSYTELGKAFIPPARDVDWKLIMRRLPKEAALEKLPVVCDRVIWEYWNGLGWARLPLDGDADALFNHQKEGQVTLSFNCPENMTSILVNAYENYWIRMRLVASSNIYSTNCTHFAPVIKGIRVAYAYEGYGMSPERLISYNNTQTEELTAALGNKESIRLFDKQSSHNTLYIGLDKHPEGSPVNIYFNLEGKDSPSPNLEWEYFSASGKWKELKVTDRTLDFKDPGIVTMAVPDDLGNTGVFGKEAYWLRVIDTNNEYDRMTSFPRIKGIYMNAVELSNVESVEEEVFFVEEKKESLTLQLSRENLLTVKVQVNEQGAELNAYSEQHGELLKMHNAEVTKDSFGNIKGLWMQWQEVEDLANSEPEDRHYMVDRFLGQIIFGNGKQGMIPPKRPDEAIRVMYSVGGGKAGNVEAGAINRMVDAIRFVGKVSNPVATHGGSDSEDMERAVKRGADMLKHGGRAVTEEDFEALALEASRNVLKVKCVSNVDQKGKLKPGMITVAVLLDEFEKGRSLFLSQKENITEFLASRASGTIQGEGIEVIEPVFIAVSTRIWIKAREAVNIYDIQRRIREKVTAFIDPIAGNFNSIGWNIGELPNKSQIFSYIKSLNLDCNIERLVITASEAGCEQLQETDMENLVFNPFYIGINGRHEIIVSYE